jgi:hypothetical protein
VDTDRETVTVTVPLRVVRYAVDGLASRFPAT